MGRHKRFPKMLCPTKRNLNLGYRLCFETDTIRQFFEIINSDFLEMSIYQQC